MDWQPQDNDFRCGMCFSLAYALSEYALKYMGDILREDAVVLYFDDSEPMAIHAAFHWNGMEIDIDGSRPYSGEGSLVPAETLVDEGYVWLDDDETYGKVGQYVEANADRFFGNQITEEKEEEMVSCSVKGVMYTIEKRLLDLAVSIFDQQYKPGIDVPALALEIGKELKPSCYNDRWGPQRLARCLLATKGRAGAAKRAAKGKKPNSSQGTLF